uniref:EF-hand domain-containing protein n=1 Tax=Aureoumbra lagunensis TaxID=44058 RepID=A0A7S3JVY8_9STRA
MRQRALLSSTKQDVDSLIEERANTAKRELAILAEAFMRYDGDASGALDRGEIERALEDLDIPGDDVYVDALMSQLDQNKDGSVSIAEWLDNLPRGTRIKIVTKYGEGSALNEYRAVRLQMPTVELLYTYTDEAPALATHSLLPIVRAFTEPSCKVSLKLVDISLAGRILAAFPENISEDKRVSDELAVLGQLVKQPQTLVIKLPNISASIPQLEAAILELQSQGYNIPSYPKICTTTEEEGIKSRYAKILGSAVNPVLREGNSDRRVAKPVKQFAQANPHKNYPWSPDSKSHVAYMSHGDFFGSEKSYVARENLDVRVEFENTEKIILKESILLQMNEIIDAATMNAEELRQFYIREMNDAKEKGVLFSLHLKATMMKVSDPIMFGHAVECFYRDTFAKHAQAFEKMKVDARNGLGDVYAKLQLLNEPSEQAAIATDLEACLTECEHVRPQLAMVDSDRGITNLHLPSDIIIDASVPAAIRDGGKMYAPDGQLADAKFVIPDRTYAKVYEAVFEDCIQNGALDPSKIGAVSNVGLMAQKAQEYGSHDKTFELQDDGIVRVIDRATGDILLEHTVQKGDIWRMCQTKDSPIQDWVKLAVSRARATGDPAIFWLDEDRAHDRSLISKVKTYLKDHDTSDLDISISKPADAMRTTLTRSRQGLDTISVTGNVLRDYLTDLFPILELGTSAKMLSIVPLLAGGGLFETGAGGSAPKHVQQLVKENHLRWDSLGEFLAIGVSLEDLAAKTNNTKAKVVADALNEAVSKLLTNDKSPKRKAGQLDNRGSHFYLALYWARALADQAIDLDIAHTYTPVAQALEESQDKILVELISAAGKPVELGGYYHVDPLKADQVMRPSPTLNKIIDSFLNTAST